MPSLTLNQKATVDISPALKTKLTKKLKRFEELQQTVKTAQMEMDL